jgi:hypothetical protein
VAACGRDYCKEVDNTVTMRERMRRGAEKSDYGDRVDVKQGHYKYEQNGVKAEGENQLCSYQIS